MYKLARIKITNAKGIMSGLGRKTLELDLTPFLDKDIILVTGDNASGKSTLVSLIHPWIAPSDGRTKFIIPGKEGTIIREYVGDGGMTMISKCIYTPKKDGGHNTKCYLEMVAPGADPVELNPNGNVSSYISLLYTYFGINKDYLSFASYNNEVSTIVKQTDQERKNSVGTMVPNIHRFTVGYDIVNDKYKGLRNVIRNVSQRILSLRDEQSLESDFHRLTRELQSYTDEREERIKKLAKIEGRLKELTNGDDIKHMIDRYNHMVASLATFDGDIDRVFNRLMKLYDKLGIEPDSDSTINFAGIDKVPSYIMKYEKKISAAESSIQGNTTRINQLRKEINQTDATIAETESALYSIQTQDIDELKKTRKQYMDQLDSLRYTKNKEKFDGMSYDEAISFSRVVVMIDQMIRALYDEYGEVLSQYFRDSDWKTYESRAMEEMTHLTATLQSTSAKRDQLYMQIAEKNQYKELQSILEQRPKTCTIDSCPFIAKALKYRGIADEIAELTTQYQDACITIANTSETCADTEKRLAVHTDAQKLVQYLSVNMNLIQKYFKVDDISIVYKAIANGTWDSILNVMTLKDIAAILSEKELYLTITMQRIPEIDHAIQLAQAYGTNREILSQQLERLQHTRKVLKDELGEYRMHVGISTTQRDRYEKTLGLWREVSENIDTYRRLIVEQLETRNNVDAQDAKIQKIKELLDKRNEQEHLIGELNDLIRSRTPQREQVKLDLDAVRRLKIEKLEVERDFTVTEVIRNIVAPGKGIQKELINIYMYEIYQVANDLLLNTFDGKLYLKEFLITDKEFTIPYVFNGSESPDISFASSAQQAMIASAINLAILSKMVDKYGICTLDELDGPLNPKNKAASIEILTKQMRYVGIAQSFIITQEPRYYEPYADVGVICFPGGEVNGKELDVIYV